MAIVIHEPLAQMFFSSTREYTETVLLPRQGTSAFLLLGVRPCEILEIVPLFEDFKAVEVVLLFQYACTQSPTPAALLSPYSVAK